jgi:hypothetical protein
MALGGTWTSTVLLDWTGGKESRSAADQLILTGVLAAGATAATGWSDWTNAEQGNAAVRRSGLVHAAGNGTAVALSSAPTSRASERARTGRLLSLAGSAAPATLVAAVIGRGGEGPDPRRRPMASEVRVRPR